MQVFMDGRMLYKSGIGRYIRNVMQETMKMDENLNYLLAGEQGEFSRFVEELPSPHLRLQIKPAKYEQDIYTVGEQIRGSFLTLKYRAADVFFYPHYNAPRFLSSNSIVTVHDLIHFRLPQYYNRPKLLLARQVLGNALKRAGRIIVISHSTADDLIAMFPGLPAGKIQVVYQGVSPFFNPAPAVDIKRLKKRWGLGCYILYVGARKPHKNLGRLVKAWLNLLYDKPGLQLVICGERSDQKDEIDIVKEKYKPEGLVEISGLTDGELKVLYSGAEAFVFPSLCEGFGLPPLEAMACGTPVIAAAASSLPEVIGEAGTYFNPYNIEEIGQQIYRILKDTEERERLVKNGALRAKEFRWETTARETLEIIRQVAQDFKRR